jgi:hypothetical protein
MRLWTLSLLVGLLFLGQPGTAQAAEGKLLRLTIDAPYPGHSTEFQLNADLPQSKVSLILERADGAHIGYVHPLRLRLSTPDGTLLAEDTAARLVGREIEIGEHRGGQVEVLAGIELPAEAGNELQNEPIDLLFRFVAEQPAEQPPGQRPTKAPTHNGPGGVHSGGELIQAALPWFALVLALAGLCLVLVIRWRKEQP